MPKLFGPASRPSSALVRRSDALESRSVNGVHNAFESPTFPLSSLALDSIYGASQSEAGESVTADSALGLPTFWRCVAILANVVAGCPLRTFKNPGKVEQFPQILDPNNFNTTYTQYELWNLVVVHLAVWGNAFVLKVRDVGPDGPGSGKIRDLKPIHPSRVEVDLENGEKVFKIIRLKSDGTIDNEAAPLELTTFEIMHIPGLGHDGVKGISVIEYCARTLGTTMAADKLAAKFYKNGTMLTGVINVKAPLTNQEQADSIRNRWQQKSGGVGHAAQVAVLDAETSFQPLTIPPEQLQFLQSRQWQANEIARWFGIPPHLVGDVEKSTSWGAGIEEQNVGFVAYTISEFTNRIEQRATREVVMTNKQYCEFDLDRLLRGNMTERFAAYGVGIVNGWLTRNEARVKENMQPIDGLDAPLVPLNMAEQSELGMPMGTLTPAADAPAPVSDQDSDPS